MRRRNQSVFIRVNLCSNSHALRKQRDCFDLARHLIPTSLPLVTLRRGFVGAIDEKPVYLEQLGERPPSRRECEKIERYFALDHPLAEICRAFPRIRHVRGPRFLSRLRIIGSRAGMPGTFITSPMKSGPYPPDLDTCETVWRAAANLRSGNLRNPVSAKIARLTEQICESARWLSSEESMATARLVARR